MTWQQTIDEEVEAIVESIVKDACEKASQKARAESIEENSQKNAINALKLGLSVEQVGQITGLPLERIKNLKDKL